MELNSGRKSYGIGQRLACFASSKGCIFMQWWLNEQFYFFHQWHANIPCIEKSQTLFMHLCCVLLHPWIQNLWEVQSCTCWFDYGPSELFLYTADNSPAVDICNFSSFNIPSAFYVVYIWMNLFWISYESRWTLELGRRSNRSAVQKRHFLLHESKCNAYHIFVNNIRQCSVLQTPTHQVYSTPDIVVGLNLL